MGRSSYTGKSYPTKRSNKSTTTITTVKQPNVTRQYVNRSLGNPMALTERKYFDVEFSGAIPSVAANWAGTELDPATLLTFFAPTQGTGFNNRVGRKVNILSIKIRCQITCAEQTNQSTADPGSICRVIFYMDKQSNATQSQGEDVIDSGAGSQAVNMYQNAANFGRFKVLRDKRYVLSNPNMSYDGTNIEQAGLAKPFQFNFKFSRNPITVHFNATNGGTFADIVDNSFHMIGNCSSATLVPTLSYKARIVFVDL